MQAGIHCHNCGIQIVTDDFFCYKCGTNLDQPNITKNEDIPQHRLLHIRTSAKTLTFIMFIVLGITAFSAYYLSHSLYKTNIPKENASSSGIIKTPTKNITDSTDKKQSANVDIAGKSQISTNLSSPLAYISLPNKKYTYYAEYPDGSKGTFERIAGKIDGVTPILTVSSLMPESKSFTEHFLIKTDGLFSITDENPKISTRYLPTVISVDKAWFSNGISSKILKINETCELSFKKFDNCILLEQKFLEAGFAFKSWIAPNVGLVKSVYSESGNIYEELRSISDISESDAKVQLKKFSPNTAAIK